MAAVPAEKRSDIFMHDIVESFRPDLFANKTILVSGGSSGLGLDVARGFARLGGNVIATGSSEVKLAALRAQPGDKTLRFERLDVRKPAEITALIGRLDRLDVLVNAAGIARPEAEFEDSTYLEVIEVNLNSAMRCTMAALGLLRASKGSVINFASMLSYLADPLVPAYGASKAGIVGLTRHLAHAFGPDGIRVNAVSPGYHKTDMTKPLWSDPAAAERIANRSALKRWGTTEDLVGICLFLASPAASFITGVDLPVDGGYLTGG
jgi:NAD(P)-dependent dehydrogenase (short-subunit alcohol dehydrogenase family)